MISILPAYIVVAATIAQMPPAQTTVVKVHDRQGQPIAGAIVEIADDEALSNKVALDPTDGHGHAPTDVFSRRPKAVLRAYRESTKGEPVYSRWKSLPEPGKSYPPPETFVFIDRLTRGHDVRTTAVQDSFEVANCEASSLQLSTPPVGYTWRLAYVKQWYDSQRQMRASQPFYELVPNSASCEPCATCP
jgi:hypothetical protein